MDQASQLKVVKEGFTILRADDYPQPRIKYKSDKQHEWATYEKFDTKAARDRELKKLLEIHAFITD